MKKLYIYGIVSVLLLAAASSISYTYRVKDTVKGTNLVIHQFEDSDGLMNQLQSQYGCDFTGTNSFSSMIQYGIDSNNEDVYNSANTKLKGKVRCGVYGSMAYELTGFDLIDTNVDEWGTTSMEGDGKLTYEITIKIKKTIPINMVFNSYQDKEDKDNFENWIEVKGIDDNFFLELSHDETQKVTHNRQCLEGCQE